MAELNQKVPVHVVSAAHLSESQLEKLQSVLQKKLGKQPEFHLEVNPSLIGGLYIQVEGLLIDRTVKAQLGGLADRLKRRNIG